jgi:hypothetical protein
MPWAPHGVADETSVAEWAAVVRTRGADGEDVVSLPRDEYRFPIRVPGEHAAIRHI